MESKEFTGSATQMKTSPWLEVADIEAAGEVTAIVEKIFEHRNVIFKDGRTVPVVYALKLKGLDPQLVVNQTNRKALMKLTGTTNTQKWIGAKVTLVAADTTFKGQPSRGIRIKV